MSPDSSISTFRTKVQFFIVSVDAQRIVLSLFTSQVLANPRPFLHSVIQLEYVCILARLLGCGHSLPEGKFGAVNTLGYVSGWPLTWLSRLDDVQTGTFT